MTTPKEIEAVAMATKAQIEFCKKHLCRELAKNRTLTRNTAKKAWPFVRRCQEAGLVDIIDPHDRFPWSWSGTRLTEKGHRAAIAALDKERGEGR